VPSKQSAGNTARIYSRINEHHRLGGRNPSIPQREKEHDHKEVGSVDERREANKHGEKIEVSPGNKLKTSMGRMK